MPWPTVPRFLLPSRIYAIRLGVLIFATWRGNLQQLLGPILTYSYGCLPHQSRCIPFQEQALRNTGESLGLAILILDSVATRPQLPAIELIVALCASAPDETLNAISTPE